MRIWITAIVAFALVVASLACQAGGGGSAPTITVVRHYWVDYDGDGPETCPSLDPAAAARVRIDVKDEAGVVLGSDSVAGGTAVPTHTPVANQTYCVLTVPIQLSRAAGFYTVHWADGTDQRTQTLSHADFEAQGWRIEV